MKNYYGRKKKMQNNYVIFQENIFEVLTERMD